MVIKHGKSVKLSQWSKIRERISASFFGVLGVSYLKDGNNKDIGGGIFYSFLGVGE